MVSAVAAPALLITPTAPRRLLLTLTAVTTLRKLTATVVAEMYMLDCNSHTSLFESSRFRCTLKH